MRVFITAGPTWVKIDDVRVLTNVFTGKTGVYLAQKLAAKKNAVTLLMNDHCLGKIKVKGVKVMTFRYFDEFKAACVKQLKQNHYDAIIHSAAVSDYVTKKVYKGKIPSRLKSLEIKLKPADKVIKHMRSLAPDSLLVQFKLEAKRRGLIEKAHASLRGNDSDLVVANAYEDIKAGYKGYIISRLKQVIEVRSKESLACNLVALIKLLAGRN